MRSGKMETPIRTGRPRVTTARFPHVLWPRGEVDLHTSRHGSVTVPPYGKHFPRGRRPQLAFASVGIVHAEFWRRFFEDRYQRSWYNEQNDRGSISLAPLGLGCLVRMSLRLMAARCVPGSNKSRLFSGLRKKLYSRLCVIVKSLDRCSEVTPPHLVMHTPVNYRLRHVHRARKLRRNSPFRSRRSNRCQPVLGSPAVGSSNEMHC